MKGLVEIINRETERVFIVGVQLKGQDTWCIDESLDELEELVGTAGGKVAGRGTQRLDRVNAASFIGPGKACEFAEQWVAEGRGRLIVEQDLIETLDATNQREGQQLADAMFSPAFWRANGVPGWLARPLSPVLRQLAKL